MKINSDSFHVGAHFKNAMGRSWRHRADIRRFWLSQSYIWNFNQFDWAEYQLLSTPTHAFRSFREINQGFPPESILYRRFLLRHQAAISITHHCIIIESVYIPVWGSRELKLLEDIPKIGCYFKQNLSPRH